MVCAGSTDLRHAATSPSPTDGLGVARTKAGRGPAFVARRRVFASGPRPGQCDVGGCVHMPFASIANMTSS